MEVLDVRKLFEIASDTNLVPVLRRRSETDSVVQLLKARDRNDLVAGRVDMTARGGRNVDGRRVGRDGGGVLVHLGEMEERLKGFRARKHRCWLDELDVVMKVLGKAIGSGPDG